MRRLAGVVEGAVVVAALLARHASPGLCPLSSPRAGRQLSSFICSRTRRTSVASSPALKPAFPTSFAAVPSAFATPAPLPAALGRLGLAGLGIDRLIPPPRERPMLLPAPFRASIAPPARPASAAPPAISGVFAFEAAFATVSPTCDVLSRTVEARCEPEPDFAELLLRLAFEERP